MAKHAKIIRIIRETVRKMEYEFAIPHFFDEMAKDSLIFPMLNPRYSMVASTKFTPTTREVTGMKSWERRLMAEP